MKVFEKKIKITKKLIKKFKSLTNDKNPIHVSKKIANKLGYKKPVVYGFLSASFLSSVIGNDVPGAESLWIDTNLKFENPVFEGDTIVIKSKILKISESSQLVLLESIAVNSNNQIIFKSISTIKASKKFIIKNIKTKNQKKIKTKNKINGLKTILIVGSSSKITIELVKSIYNNYDKFIFIRNSSGGIKKNKKYVFFKYDFTKKINFEKLKKFVVKNNCDINSILFLASEKLIFKNPFDTNHIEIINNVKVQAISLYEIIRNFRNNMRVNKTSIVCIGSEVLSSKPPKKMLSYVIGKHAMHGLVKSLAEELGPDGIRLNLISPGIVDELSNSFPEISKEMFKVNSSLGNLVKVKDIVNLIMFLISTKSKNITGQNIKANSGYSFN